MSNFKNFSVMKKIFKFMTLATAAVAAIVFTGCSSDDEFLNSNGGEKAPQTRAGLNPDGSYTITFDDFPNSMMAGPTSEGQNCIIPFGSSAQKSDITEISDNAPYEYFFASVFNEIGDQQWARGGVALSHWNYWENPADSVDGWWFTYHNQCSVYNESSVSGSNANAGHSGSNFGVVYGYNDTWTNNIGEAMFFFGEPHKIVDFWYANTSYTYGVIMNGNEWYNPGATKPSGSAKNLKDSNGWFKVIMYCYDMDMNLLATQEKYLADYRVGQTQVDPVTTWTKWTVNVDNVMFVKFNFEGSDVDPQYGLNTPAYLCIDDITIR